MVPPSPARRGRRAARAPTPARATSDAPAVELRLPPAAEAIRWRLEQLQAISDLAEAAGRAEGVAAIYNAALDALHRALRADRASILLFDGAGVMRFEAWRGLSEGYRRAVEGHSPWKPGEPDPQAVLVEDVDREPSLAAFRGTIRDEGIRALAFIPLLHGGRLLGKFMVYYDRPHRFAPDEVALARTIASNVAFVIERRRAEQRLKLYREIFQASLDGIAIIDLQGRYLEQNPAHRALTGYADEDLMGRTPAIHLGEETFQHVAAELAATGRFRGECRSRSKSGRETTVDLSAFPVTGDDGQPACFVGIKRDISGRKMVEDELQARARQQAAVAQLGLEALGGLEMEPLLRRAVDIVATTLRVDFVAVTEPVPPGDVMVVRAGTGWREGVVGSLVPASEATLPGLALRKGFPVIVPDVPAEPRLTAPTLQEHGVRSGVGVPIHGRTEPLGVLAAHTATPREFRADDVHFLQSVANVLAAAVERKRDEAQLREANERLQELDRLKTQFLNVVSHELRTPLTPIAIQLHLLKSLGPGEGQDRQRRAVEVLERNMDRLGLLIQDVLDVARLQGGRLVVQRDPVDLADLVAEVAETFEPAARQAGVGIAVAADAPLRIEADAHRVTQVLFNLLSNALKFTPSGGHVEIQAAPEGDEVVVRVRDTGMGLRPQDLGKLFQPFSQVHDTLAKAKAGTGLGLFICKGIVEAHGGRIWAESEGPGKGATFAFALPLP